MKTLLLVRHAKSSWGDASLSDFDRPLNARGERDAPDMGRRLARRGLRPEVVITSAAKRARTTARLLADEIDCARDEIRELESLYAAGVDGILLAVQAINDAAHTAMLVGHNPDCSKFANRIPPFEVDHFPTCAVACIEFDTTRWAAVEPRNGRMVFFDYPKNRDHGPVGGD